MSEGRPGREDPLLPPSEWVLVFGGNTDTGLDGTVYAVNPREAVWKVRRGGYAHTTCVGQGGL